MKLFRSEVSTLSLVALTAITGAGLRAAPSLDVEHHARSVQPGEVVVLEVRPSEPVVAVQATAFGATIRFFSDGAGGVWRGIVGIDLEARPDDYPVAVRATLGNGDTVRATYVLSVAPKDFPTRQLSVNPSFVQSSSGRPRSVRSRGVAPAEDFSNIERRASVGGRVSPTGAR